MHATLLITDNVRIAIEDGQFSCGIFLDLSKAFDTVDHSKLIRKLGHYGICGIANDWFTSYVHNRRQYVTIGSSKSDELVVTHGVPQGSVLGHLLLFLYYISLVEQFWKLETSEILGGEWSTAVQKRQESAWDLETVDSGFGWSLLDLIRWTFRSNPMSQTYQIITACQRRGSSF